MEDNKYQITKTVRFKLEPVENEKESIDTILLNGIDDNNVTSLADFITNIRKFVQILKSIIYREKEFEEKDENTQITQVIKKIVWNPTLEVKYRWVRTYHKSAFYNNTYNKSKNKKYSLNSLDYVRKDFDERWFIEVEDIIRKLQKANEQIELMESNKLHTQKGQRNVLLTRKTIISSELWRLSKRTIWEYAKAFIECLGSTDETIKDIHALQNSYRDKTRGNDKILGLDSQLKNITNQYSPTQSNGIQVAGASFNYYTINKRCKDYGSEISELIEKLNNEEHSLDEYKNKFQDAYELIKNCPTYYNDVTKQTITIDLSKKYQFEDLVGHIKGWRAYQKRKFNEALQLLESNPNNNDLSIINNIELYKFESEKDLKTFVALRREIFNLKNKLKNKNIADKQSIKIDYDNKTREAGSYFVNDSLYPTNCKKLSKYKNFCSFMLKVAGSQSRDKNRLKNCEREKTNAELLNFWSFIYEKSNGEKWLYCIPRELPNVQKDDEFSLNLSNAKDEIEKYIVHNVPSQKDKLYYINSLSFRALRKLCFNNKDFFDKLSEPTYTDKYTGEEKRQFKFKWVNGEEFKLQGSEKESQDQQKIRFYKNVLTVVLNNQDLFGVRLIDYKQLGQLILPQNEIASLPEFEAELNKICYKRMVCVNEELETTLMDSFHAIRFKITSQDVENNTTHCTPTEIWNEYWKLDKTFNTRMNPEIKILWRDAREHPTTKYKGKEVINGRKMKNRYYKPQYTLAMTFSEGADKPKYETSYKTLEEKLNEVENFNKKLPKLNYAIGIDEGTDDLAVITFLKNDKANNKQTPQLFKVVEIKDEVFNLDKKNNPLYNYSLPYINAKTGEEKRFYLMKNPSYFLNRTLFKKVFPNNNFDTEYQKLFITKEVCSINLTTAKVINGIIVANGDFITHQKLKELNAQIKMIKHFQLITDKSNKGAYPSINFNFDARLNWNLQDGTKEEIIYRHKKNYECIKTFKEVKINLEKRYNDAIDSFTSNINYEDTLESVSLIDKINKTRKVLVGNMVGVLTKLYKMHNCYFCFEDFDVNEIESKKAKFEGDIIRPLERSLYERFRKDAMVPMITEIIRLKDKQEQKDDDTITKKNVLKQIGIIKYVDKAGTSTTCPCCGKVAYISGDKKYKCLDGTEIKEQKDVFYLEDKNSDKFICRTAQQCSETPQPNYSWGESRNNEKLGHGCGFDNSIKNKSGYESLDTNDKIAGFNIAKLAFVKKLG